jgi:hypothetical protein
MATRVQEVGGIGLVVGPDPTGRNLLKATGEAMKGSDFAVTLDVERLRGGFHGITPSWGGALAECVSVCLQERGHKPPTPVRIEGTVAADGLVLWSAPSEQACRCWADPEEATENGACGIACLVAVEVFGFEVIERSKKGPGFDYWVGGEEDVPGLFQRKARMEVSGMRGAEVGEVNARLKKKLKQTAPSAGQFPALGVVIEFGRPLVLAVKK